MAKTGTSDFPPLSMILQGGKLVPATPWDLERLETYRSGTKFRVRVVIEESRWGVRKWWGVIGHALKTCETPWENRDEASEAIKLKLRLVTAKNTEKNGWVVTPKSLNDLDDPELNEAVERMLDYMFEVTGVNPDEWRKQVPLLERDDMPEDTPPGEPDSGEEGIASPAPIDPEPEQPADDPARTTLTELERAWLVAVYKGLAAAVGDDADVVRAQVTMFRDAYAKQHQLAKGKFNKIYNMMLSCCGEAPGMKLNDAAKQSADLIGVSVKDLV